MKGAAGQAPQSWNSGQIFQGIKKLNVLGSVLYVAAHPDDENTRLISWLANDELYRTGYLSLTRGDGGQNLIGDEQGVELGLIRTQELLAARRLDGGEQFFTSAYDFGYSKTPKETFTKWNREKILSDVVWVIRKFQPDVIITRFPVTGEGGHGHHTASAILANEAFTAAADPNRFPEQLKLVKPWQAKRILWNTFNFGGNNTTSENQFKLDVGGFNPLLGKGYGEIAALSRSQHKSQGFGSSATRGSVTEYFINTGGSAPGNGLMDGVETNWERLGKEGESIRKHIALLEKSFNPEAPQLSVHQLVNLFNEVGALPAGVWKQKKLAEIQQLVAQCSGLYMDININQPYAVQTDSVTVNVSLNNRLGADVLFRKMLLENIEEDKEVRLERNRNLVFSRKLVVPSSKEITQPYWLKEKMDEGHFHIPNQQLVGTADAEPAYLARLVLSIEGTDFSFDLPVKYRNTDPVKGEQYQPLYVIPRATLTTSPQVLLFDNKKKEVNTVSVALHANTTISGQITAGLRGIDDEGTQKEMVSLEQGQTKTFRFQVTNAHFENAESSVTAFANQETDKEKFGYYLALRSIDYEHIPSVKYFYPDLIKVLNIDLKKAGRNIGYIPGAGDKVADILEQMGYQVTILDQQKLAVASLAGFDAIITGVRAYNTNEWMNSYYDKLMNYVQQGGNLIVQYNTSSNIGPVKAKIGPYPFEISRNRITDENAKVNFEDPGHKALNFPNRITEKDFEGWIQERSIYHAARWNNHFKSILSMADPDEAPDGGSLIISKYGKGYFTYTGLVFFRELPAAVPGAMRLIANLIALNQPQPTVKK